MTHLPSLASLLPILLALACAPGCADASAKRATPTMLPPIAADATQPVDLPGLPNVVIYEPEIYCGGAPEGDAGFSTLVALGIKTVLSVDGQLPEVDTAAAHGLRYVHLPIGYDGVPAARGKEIAAVVARMPKPIYIHCHHGKHRSAAAAATACVIDGMMTPEAAIARMHVSGTAADYEGLFASARNAKPLPLDQLPEHPEQFPSRSKMSGTIEIMVAVDAHFDDLKMVRGDHWQVPSQHPDLVPAVAAQQLHDLFTNLANDNDSQQQPVEFHQFLQQATAHSQTLQAALVARDDAACETAYQALNQSCKQCHKQFRNRR